MKSPEIIIKDPYLKPFESNIQKRITKSKEKEIELTNGNKLSDFANAYNYFGLHKTKNGYIYRDWLPNAEKVYLIGDFSNWEVQEEFQLNKKEFGNFEISISEKILKHKDLYKLKVFWNGGNGDRIPAYARRVVQDSETQIFNAQVWFPDNEYKFVHKSPKKKNHALIYEAHIGMASQECKVATYKEFTKNILPKIANLGYDTVQLMAIQEHPYYGSFGYHVSNFFAASSRFGTPDELKLLIDTAHSLGIRVIMDLIHSHAVKNEVEGISKYDGSDYQFFHQGLKGYHTAWDSRCFDYGKNQVLHFLLSNCKFWIEEYNFDGFRFDGITSMLYFNHGLATDFTSYDKYFSENLDIDAAVYLSLANKLIHEIKPDAITIAEDMSGMPGLAEPIKKGGFGFDYRLAMGVPDYWIKIIKEVKDENWHVGEIFNRLKDKRENEKTVSYSESHDQALVGDKTIIFRLADKDMYDFMAVDKLTMNVERAVALHKMIRLITIATAQSAYLNFMGNELGHPEWIDFPRAGNNWSYNFARRLWNLSEDKNLAYYYLNSFDADMIKLFSTSNILTQDFSNCSNINEYDQVLAFSKGKFLFVFNFNPFISFTDYGISCDESEYKILLSTDNKKYLGLNRIDQKMVYKTYFEETTNQNFLKLYLPARTAVVLKKM
jgi:1,4-alpha-glucan branching enzyme